MQYSIFGGFIFLLIFLLSFLLSAPQLLADNNEGIIQPSIYGKLWDVFLQKKLFILTLSFTIPCVYLIERWIPVRRNQTFINTNVAQDIMWLVSNKAFKITVLVWYVSFLEGIYDTHFSLMTMNHLSELPVALRFMLGFLLLDFLNWLHHFLKHKIPWLWYFHEVHHSQREMSLFTDFRFHFAEDIIAETVKIFPLLILQFNAPEIIGILVFEMFLTRFYHANIKTNLGPLRYLLVTPQSHRIHHSIEKAHYDKNYGVLLSIWDRLFRTQYCGYDEYPETGIKEASFPHELATNYFLLVNSFIRQVIYPFRKILESIYFFFRPTSRA